MRRKSIPSNLNFHLTIFINVLAVFIVFFIVASQQPAFAISGEVLDQNGKSFSGATVTETYGSTTVNQVTTASGYNFADPCSFAMDGQPGGVALTLTLTVPSGYYATTATSGTSTSYRGEFLQPGTGCGQTMVGGVWKHYLTLSDPATINFGITNVPPDCTTTPISCSACTAPANTCSNGNGTQTCSLSQPATCSPVVISQSCTLNNCNAGSDCVSQVCQVITYTISGNVSDNTGAGVPGVTVSAGGNNVTTDANGNYTSPSLVPGSYTVAMTVPAGYAANGATSQTVTLASNQTGVNFKLNKFNQISGTVYNDTNENGTLDNGEAGYQGITVKVTNGSGTQTTTSAADGNYSFQVNPTAGNSTVTISGIPAGWFNSSPASQTVASTVNTTGLNFGIAAEDTISGNVFVDLNRNGIKDGTEANYAASPAITSSSGTVTPSATGSYTITNLTPGTYTITYGGQPAGYYMTSPLTGPPITFKVTVGSGCTVNTAPGAVCTAGNITNLSFGISNTYPWFQSTCGDIRNDNGITDTVPAGLYGLIAASSCNNPGIAFTGNTNASFGSGQASTPTNQVVGGANYPELYAAPDNPLQTGYNALLAKAQQAGVTPTDLSTKCTLTSCTLPAGLGHGIYLANGNVTLNAYTFPANQDFVILINGNLTINGAISVPVGSTALFSTNGNITVNPTVGTGATVTTSSLDGWYVAGGSFILPSQGGCNDLRLNIAGSVVVNALGGGGTFQNNRDLCGADTADPSVSFLQRLDMILNAPQFLETQQTLSQEVAP